MSSLEQTLVFLIHAIKQFCFGFETLNDNADRYQDGSAAKAFYMSAIYNYLAVFYLLDKNKGDPVGGCFYGALKPHGLADILEPIRETLESPVGTTTFGEIVRIFRNKAIVHARYRDDDVDRIYAAADMADPAIAAEFHALLWQVYEQTRSLPVAMIRRCGLKLEDFGIREVDS